jgi:hypothetical protein
VQLADDLEQRLGGVMQRHQFALRRIERLNLRARRLTGKNALLGLLDLCGQRVQHREIAIDHGIE